MTTLCEIDTGMINSIIPMHHYEQAHGIRQMKVKPLVFKVPGSTDVQRIFLALGQLKCLNYTCVSNTVPLCQMQFPDIYLHL